VASGLPTLEALEIVGQRPSTVLSMLAKRIEGGWYLDASGDVHLFGSSGETGPRAPTAPLALTNTSARLQAFAHDSDLTLLANRVVVEARRTTVPLGIDVSAWPSLAFSSTLEIPVKSGEPFDPSGGYVRIGTQRCLYTSMTPSFTLGVNLAGTTVATAVSVGATSIEVADETPGNNTTWCQIGDQFLYFGAVDTGPDRLVNIPASGPGSVQAPIAVGAPVQFLHVLNGIPSSGADGLLADQPKDVDAVAFTFAEDGTSVTNYGTHETVLQASDLSLDSAAELAAAELARFKEPVIDASWVSRDMNAAPGRAQVITWTGSGALSTTLTIVRTQVEITVDGAAPERHCTGNNIGDLE
jgi:hypothetical protein